MVLENVKTQRVSVKLCYNKKMTQTLSGKSGLRSFQLFISPSFKAFRTVL